MSNPLFVDTGYVIALVNSQDQYHQQAMQLSEKYEGYRVITTDAILLEIGNALSRIARQEAATIIHYFQTASEATVVSLTPVLLTSAIQIISWSTENERGGIWTPDPQNRNLLLYPLSYAPSITL